MIDDISQINVPEGWILCKMEDVADIIGGGTPDTKQIDNFDDNGFPWITPKDLSNWNSVYIKNGTRSLSQKGLDSSSATQMPKNTVLMSSRAPIGYLAIAANPISTNQGFKNFICYPGIEPEYVFYWLKSIVPFITSMASGTTFLEISGSRAKNIPFLLCPLNEQKRIADKMEELLPKVEAIKQRQERASKIVKRFRQTVLSAACSGKLTEGWRDKNIGIEKASELVKRIRHSHEFNGLGHGGKAALPTEGIHDLSIDQFPESWTIEELQWLCESGRSITYGILKPGPNISEGIPYIRVADFPNDELMIGGIRKTSQAIANSYQRSSLITGDLLLSIRGTVGRVARIPPELDGANITQDTARISVHHEMNSHYVELYLRSPSVQNRLKRAMKGVAVRGVNIGDIRVTQVAVPPLFEQQEIVRRVEYLFNLADSIEERIKAAKQKTERLTESLLAKAFRGELVPTETELAIQENRDYEPASVLLERIRSDKTMKRDKPRTVRTKNQVKRTEMNKESVMKAIGQFSDTRFSFDELRDIFPDDYEALKTILFDLLSESKPIITQFFDENSQAMRFIREAK